MSLMNARYMPALKCQRHLSGERALCRLKKSCILTAIIPETSSISGILIKLIFGADAVFPDTLVRLIVQTSLFIQCASSLSAYWSVLLVSVPNHKPGYG